VPAHVLVQPNQQRTARSQRFVVFLPVSLPVARLGRCLLPGRICATKPSVPAKLDNFLDESWSNFSLGEGVRP
jgi:hypothetical protein